MPAAASFVATGESRDRSEVLEILVLLGSFKPPSLPGVDSERGHVSFAWIKAEPWDWGVGIPDVRELGGRGSGAGGARDRRLQRARAGRAQGLESVHDQRGAGRRPQRGRWPDAARRHPRQRPPDAEHLRRRDAEGPARLRGRQAGRLRHDGALDQLRRCHLAAADLRPVHRRRSDGPDRHAAGHRRRPREQLLQPVLAGQLRGGRRRPRVPLDEGSPGRGVSDRPGGHEDLPAAPAGDCRGGPGPAGAVGRVERLDFIADHSRGRSRVRGGRGGRDRRRVRLRPRPVRAGRSATTAPW